MSYIPILIDTLKQEIKSQGKTYGDVALRVGVSTSTVKRWFADKQMNLIQLEAVCDALEMDIVRLVNQMQNRQLTIEQLSWVQEEEIAKDLVLLLVTVCVLNRWTMSDILAHYHLEEAQLIQKLLVLDRLGIIALLPDNHVRLQVSPNFGWIAGGPIHNFFHDMIGKEFFAHRFADDHEVLHVLNGMLSEASASELNQKIERMVAEFMDANRSDSQLALKDRKGYTAVFALRDWRYSAFEALRK